MTLVVLDYEYGNIHYIKNIPENIENLEDFVYNTLGYKDSEVSWILLEDNFRPIIYTYDRLLKKKVYDNDNFIDDD